jgi:aspartokinase/homoserine dehydrogenase 1
VIDGSGIATATWKKTFAAAEQKVDLKAVFDAIKRYKMVNPIFVDVTASDEVAASYIDILRAGVHIVTPNKKANSREQSYYDALMDLSKEHRLHYYYETTVGAGLPIIRTIKDLKNSGDEILRIEGILSGTLSYLFNTMSAERSFSAVVREANRLGYTEPDPRDDLSGLDVARKILILSREIGLKMELSDIDIEALLPAEMTGADLDTFWQKLPQVDSRFESERLTAAKSGLALRYIASLVKGHCRVAVEKIPVSHPLARSGATDNIIQITTKRYSENPLIIQGPGAGRDVTAGGVFADIISLSFHLP